MIKRLGVGLVVVLALSFTIEGGEFGRTDLLRVPPRA